MGPAHPSTALALNSLAALSLAEGEARAALAASVEAAGASRNQLRLTAAGLSEREALLVAGAGRERISIVLSAAAELDQPGATLAAWDELARSRGLVLDVMAERRRAATQGPELAPLRAAADSAARRSAQLTSRGPGRDGPEAYRERLAAARRDHEAAERALGGASASHRARQDRARVGIAEVAAALRPGTDALVAYCRFSRVPAGLPEGVASPRPETQYLAFVLRGGAKAPRLVPLGGAAEMDQLVSLWRSATTWPGPIGEVRAAGHELTRAAWEPLAAALGDAQRVFIVPDGSLLTVNFGALPAADGSWLVESGPVLHHLSAERDLVPVGREGAHAAEGLLAVGGADFSASPWQPETSVVRARAPSGLASLLAKAGVALIAQRGGSSGCEGFGDLSFEDLPATRSEAQEVARAWRGAKGATVESKKATLLTGAWATEEAFKTLAGSHRVLHVATHGFFLGDECGQAGEATRGVVGLGIRARPAVERVEIENPLLRSGLALAGFNRRAETPAGQDDGVLTAQEVASLDLSGVEWAVLSACDTDRGDVAGGEGVLGLQRAFRIAGAQTLIMSLWAVDDEATREWMAALYRARLKDGLDAPESARAASLSLIAERRRRGLSVHPFYWGAFVTSGSADRGR
jgi:CHAT domain-containing protein